jgi:hypothetical protein
MRFLIAISLLFCASIVAAQTSAPQPKPCSEAEQKQFNFWVGIWDATWPGQNNTSAGHGKNRIERVLDGCVVQENFSGEGAGALHGISISTFNTRSGKWQQTWVDNQGGYLDFTGEFKNGQMILSRDAARPDGTKIIQRMVWKNITHDEFDWSWESSKDGGKTWQVNWPIHYRRKS